MTTQSKMLLIKKLPVGYRLNPSDEDLVNHHLKRKLMDIKEECCLIPDIDIYKFPPWDLITKYNDLSDLASVDGECFFYHRRNDPNSKRDKRMTEEGFWKVTGKGRKPRVTDKTKWLKKILVYYTGKQKSAVKTDWAMHEYQNISEPGIVLCRVHKIKAKKVKGKVESGSCQACNGSPAATASPKSQTEPPKISPKVTRDESYQVNGSRTYPRGVTFEEGGHVSAFHQTPIDQSSNNVLLGFQYPPQHPRTMPAEDISLIVGNISFNDSGSKLDIQGGGAQLPFASQKHGAQDTNFKEAPQSTLNSQTSIPPLNPCLLSPKEQMLQQLLSISHTHPLSDSFGGGILNLFQFGQSYEAQQTNLEVPQDGSYQVDGSQTYPCGVTFKGGGDVSAFHQTPSDQSSNNVLPVFQYPPQHPQTMPTEDISVIVGNMSFNNSGSKLDIHGGAAQLPFASQKHGAQDTNFKEAPQSTINSQTSIPPPNPCLLSPKEQMLQQLLSISRTHPLSDSFGGGIPNLFQLGQSYEAQQTNLEVPQDESYQVDCSQTYPCDVTLEEGGNMSDMSAFHQTRSDQSSNNVFPVFQYSPQHPRTMPTEDISVTVGNMSFNNSGSKLDIHGGGAQLPFASQKHGAQDTNFKEAPQSTINSQTSIPPPNPCLLSRKEQMLQQLLSISRTHSLSDSFGGGIPNLFQFGQSYEAQQTNLEVPRDESYQVDCSQTYPCGVTLEEGGNMSDMSAFHQTRSDQSSNNVFPVFQYSPQHPRTMPTEDISVIVGNMSFNNSGSKLDIHGGAAQLPFASQKHGAQDTNFKEAPQSTINSQTSIPPPNPCLLSPKEQMLQQLLSISRTHPLSDSFGGGIPNLFQFGQSYEEQQTNLEVIRDGSYQVDGNYTYPRGVTLEEGGNMSVYRQTPTDQSSNCVLLGSLYPPQHPQMMPSEEISPIIGNTSFSDSGSELDIHGHGAQLPFASQKHGAQETNFKVTQGSTTGLSAVIQYLDNGLLLGSLLASSLPSEAAMEGSSLPSSCIVPGVYGTDYQGLPYASGVALDKSNHRISAAY